MEIAAAKMSRPHMWDDEVTVLHWSQLQTSSNSVYTSVHITKVLQTPAARTVEHH